LTVLAMVIDMAGRKVIRNKILVSLLQTISFDR
jgi:hypothetical protein